MFKKSLIAVAVLGATAFSVQAADVTMYGKVDTGLQYQSNEITIADYTLLVHHGKRSELRFPLRRQGF